MMTVSQLQSIYFNSNPLLLIRRCYRLNIRQSSSFLFGRATSLTYNSTTTKRRQQQQQQQQHNYYSTVTPSSLYQSPFRLGDSPFHILWPHRRRWFSWWNPFSKGGSRDTNAVMGSARTKSESEMENPRKIQERKDLTLLMLATEFRNIASEEERIQKEEENHHNGSSSSSYSNDVYLENREKLIDMAFDRLNEMEIDSKGLMQLRYALQSALEKQAVEYFTVFGSIDEELLLLVTSDKAEANTISQIDSYLGEILRLESERTIDELAKTSRTRAPKGVDPKEFLTLKRGAIETLLNCEGEQNNCDNNSKTSTVSEKDNNEINKINLAKADEFGYHVSVDQEKNRLIRYYQKVNICRSAKMRDSIGYSVIALQSSIPGAGRGVYVDGYARAGSILAFQPGKVWAKESLTNISVEEERDLERNDTYQMSLRPDDYMIDSRRSPYTVLTDDNSNLMALGHIVNHPTPSNPPNARSAMLNFTQGMDLGSSSTLRRYIPNTYARPKNQTIMDSLWDRDVIEMHSLVLVATRDICNEEIFYDYRLASSHLPQWYHPVKDTAFVVDNKEDNSEVDDNNEQENNPSIKNS